MMSEPHPRPRWAAVPEESREPYRAFSALALVSLILGLVSFVSLFGLAWLVVPAVAVVFSAIALWRIAARAPELTGRRLAVAGLLLATLFAGSGVGYHFVRQRLLDRQAAQAALDWFQLLAHRKPHMAFQLTFPPESRRPLSDDLWNVYRDIPEQGQMLRKFVAKPLVETLLALGTEAKVQFYCTAGRWARNHREGRTDVFAVTYDDAKDGKKTFLVAVSLEQAKNVLPNRLNWTVAGFKAGVVPAELMGTKVVSDE